MRTDQQVEADKLRLTEIERRRKEIVTHLSELELEYWRLTAETLAIWERLRLTPISN